jgi:hypothetical protein
MAGITPGVERTRGRHGVPLAASHRASSREHSVEGDADPLAIHALGHLIEQVVPYRPDYPGLRLLAAQGGADRDGRRPV